MTYILAREEGIRQVNGKRWLECSVRLEPRPGNEGHLETAELECDHFHFSLSFFLSFPSITPSLFFSLPLSFPSKLVG